MFKEDDGNGIAPLGRSTLLKNVIDTDISIITTDTNDATIYSKLDIDPAAAMTRHRRSNTPSRKITALALIGWFAIASCSLPQNADAASRAEVAFLHDVEEYVFVSSDQMITARPYGRIRITVHPSRSCKIDHNGDIAKSSISLRFGYSINSILVSLRTNLARWESGGSEPVCANPRAKIDRRLPAPAGTQDAWIEVHVFDDQNAYMAAVRTPSSEKAHVSPGKLAATEGCFIERDDSAEEGRMRILYLLRAQDNGSSRSHGMQRCSTRAGFVAVGLLGALHLPDEKLLVRGNSSFGQPPCYFLANSFAYGAAFLALWTGARDRQSVETAVKSRALLLDLTSNTALEEFPAFLNYWTNMHDKRAQSDHLDCPGAQKSLSGESPPSPRAATVTPPR